MTVTSTPVQPAVELVPADRCDRCGGPAYVAVATQAGPLLFCAHDFRKHELALVASGAEVTIDQRDRLLLPPG